jgi:hypothetical protein
VKSGWIKKESIPMTNDNFSLQKKDNNNLKRWEIGQASGGKMNLKKKSSTTWINEKLDMWAVERWISNWTWWTTQTNEKLFLQST